LGGSKRLLRNQPLAVGDRRGEGRRALPPEPKPADFIDREQTEGRAAKGSEGRQRATGCRTRLHLQAMHRRKEWTDGYSGADFHLRPGFQTSFCHFLWRSASHTAFSQSAGPASFCHPGMTFSSLGHTNPIPLMSK